MTKFLTKEGHEIKANTLYEMVGGRLFLPINFMEGHIRGVEASNPNRDAEVLVYHSEWLKEYLLRPHQPIPGAYTEDGTPICIGWEYKRRDGSVDRILGFEDSGDGFKIRGEKYRYYYDGKTHSHARDQDLITRHIPAETEDEGWIKLNGVNFPALELSQRIDVKCRDGRIIAFQYAASWGDRYMHTNSPWDIIEYRLSRSK